MEIWFLDSHVELLSRMFLSAATRGGFEWTTGMIVPTFAAFASTAVAVVSVGIANRAKDIAEASERARVRAETDRVRRDQIQRLDSAIRDMFVGTATLIRDIEILEDAVREWRMSQNMMPYYIQHGLPLPAQPTPPSEAALLALVAAARLEAFEPSEIGMLDAVRDVIEGIQTVPTDEKKRRLAKISDRVLAWRHAASTEKDKSILAFKDIFDA